MSMLRFFVFAILFFGPQLAILVKDDAAQPGVAVESEVSAFTDGMPKPTCPPACPGDDD